MNKNNKKQHHIKKLNRYFFISFGIFWYNNKNKKIPELKSRNKMKKITMTHTRIYRNFIYLFKKILFYKVSLCFLFILIIFGFIIILQRIFAVSLLSYILKIEL